MIDVVQTAPEALCVARRYLEFLPEVKLLEDLAQFDDEPNLWHIKVRISIFSNNKDIPADTDWYIKVSASYPLGDIEIYPAVENGITNTWPHQSNNGCIDSHGLWRLGNICVAVSSFFNNEGQPTYSEERLKWYVERSILWLKAAEADALQNDNDYYELPHYTSASNFTVAFSEDTVSYLNWEGLECSHGYAKITNDPTGNVKYIATFCNEKKQKLFSSAWGKYIRDLKKKNTSSIEYAIWIMLNEPPVVHGFQAPICYDELVAAMASQNVNFYETLWRLVPQLRDGKSHLLLIGFPIPEFCCGENKIVSWQALQLPKFAYGRIKVDGFRAKSEDGYRQWDKRNLFASKSEVNWLRTKNWDSKAISTRGQHCNALQARNILLIGAGCLGSTLSELLVRGNVANITIVDSDRLEAGNLSRHTLSFPDVSDKKEKLLAFRLNQINPHANAEFIPNQIDLDNMSIVDKYHTIIDCTGADEVLDLFETCQFKKKSYFISYSISYAANEIYFFVDYGYCVRVSDFKKIIKRNVKMPEEPMPRDGIGCWHPLFPARVDEIYMASSLVVQYLNKIFTDQQTFPIALVLEKSRQNGIATGYSVKEAY